MFISCAKVDSLHANALIQKLRQVGIAVSHSPRNPADDEDERWMNWYSGGGQAQIMNEEIFVVIVTEGWDCSTWMAFEASEALKGLRQGMVKRMLQYNPTNIKVDYPEDKMHWLGEKLPDNLEEAVALLKTL
ncbi:hypothetical protein EON83_14615 [bacterium]|nr:MAG: hypothetical protein EON83_14615 [bacterium]